MPAFYETLEFPSGEPGTRSTLGFTGEESTEPVGPFREGGRYGREAHQPDSLPPALDGELAD